MKKVLLYIFFVLEGVFALIGLIFVGVFIAMQFGVLNVRGSMKERNQFFFQQAKVVSAPSCVDTTTWQCHWTATPEWAVVMEGLRKDQGVIADVHFKTGVSERMIASVVVPEQIRFFTAEREIFKSYFEPLKILGSLSQFSLGVSGIKQETALKIEEYAASTTSPFYPGPGYAELIAYEPGAHHDAALYGRLTDSKNHYYSYLYTALFIKEIESQWERAGFGITQDPGAITTLFNIGFGASRPNANPSVGGAPIQSGGNSYSYGELGALFYTSDELRDIFPS